MKRKALAIIPARGKSKGIPRKNIRDLEGKPLIAHTIEAAQKSESFDRIIVSTDDDEIKEISEGFGAEVIRRPPELGEDKSPTIDSIFHVLDALEKDGYRPDDVMLLQPTSPLRTITDIVNAIRLYRDSDCDSLISVCEMIHPPYWALRIEGRFLIPIFLKKKQLSRRQDLPKSYLPNGAIFISSTTILKKSRGFYSERIIPYIMPSERSLDLDTEMDFEIAKYYLRLPSPCTNKENRIMLGKKIIGDGYPTLIIAEAGVNHNGSIRLAKKLILAAKNAGADAVKFQTYVTEDLIKRKVSKAPYQQKNKEDTEDQFEMLKRLELTFKEVKELKEFADEKGITFLSTPFDLKSVKVLERIGVPAFKIGSGDLTNISLLKYVALRKRPVLLSTGMASMDDIQLALNTIRSTGNNQIAIMHCTSEYPASLSDCNLRAIGTLKQAFQVPVGYSDHTIEVSTPAFAVSAGACFIEKHLTLDYKMKGPDHKASLEPNEFQEMIQEIRRTEELLGSPLKKPTNGERKMRRYVRKSIVSATDIEKGKIIKDSMLTVKRPGTGIEPKYLPELIGMISRKRIEKDMLISWDMVEGKTKAK